MLLVIAVLCQSLVFFDGDTNKNPVDDKIKCLDGTWILVACEEKGHVLTAEDIKAEPLTCIIKGNNITFDAGKTKDSFIFEIVPDSRPAKLNLIDPTNKEKINHAIYSLEDKKLIICISRKMNPNQPEERPIKFSSKREDNNNLHGLILVVFEKKK